MDKALREHGLTVPQYATLELLDQQPGLLADLDHMAEAVGEPGPVPVFDQGER
jgi:hypothetical protein